MTEPTWPECSSSRVFPARREDSFFQRVLKFGTSKVPKLTKQTLVNTEIHLLIQYIHQLLRHEAFDDFVLRILIDSETITLLEYVFAPTETAWRHRIVSHWTVGLRGTISSSDRA